MSISIHKGAISYSLNMDGDYFGREEYMWGLQAVLVV